MGERWDVEWPKFSHMKGTHDELTIERWCDLIPRTKTILKLDDKDQIYNFKPLRSKPQKGKMANYRDQI